LFFFFVADILPLAVNSKLKRNANNPKGRKERKFSMSG
jgi:hypothetical protein